MSKSTFRIPSTRTASEREPFPLQLHPGPETEPPNAEPFVKWVGGKRTLVRSLAKLIPPQVDQYWEPFTGGGALFFHLSDRIGDAHLSDAIPELIETYRVVRDHPEALINSLLDHARQHHDPDYYYQVRALHKLMDPIQAASRMIYLNRTGFNGLYRVNRQGHFNVARGSYRNPVICNPQAIRAASKALQKAALQARDFAHNNPGPGSFVYCDTPHDRTYSGYTNPRFTAKDQGRLRDQILLWAGNGATVMTSNADTPLIQELYAEHPFHIRKVEVPRFISADGKSRGNVTELLITTYDAGETLRP